eukprot:75759_1
MSVSNCDTQSEYIDNRTKLIVYGFIHRIQKLHPTEISFITLKYVDDHFLMHRGGYQWKITNPKLIQNILAAPVGETFTSDIFNFATAQWIISLIPNSNAKSGGGVYVGIQNLTWPTGWSHVELNFIIECKELNAKFITMTQYKKMQSWGWTRDTISINEILEINPKQLTFTVTMRLTRVFSFDYYTYSIKYKFKVINYRKHYKLKWVINNKNRSKSRRIFSNIVGEMFCGFYDTIDSSVAVKLCGLPNQSNDIIVDAMQLKWTIHIIEADMTCSKVAKLGYYGTYVDDKYNRSSSGLTCQSAMSLPCLSLDDYKEYNNIHFEINIEILNEYGLYGEVIGGDDYTQQWDEYAKKQFGMKDKRKKASFDDSYKSYTYNTHKRKKNYKSYTSNTNYKQYKSHKSYPRSRYNSYMDYKNKNKVIASSTDGWEGEQLKDFHVNGAIYPANKSENKE